MLTEEQLKNRQKGIGASEAAIVLGLNPFVSPYKLWSVKTGRCLADDLSDVPQVYWGNMHEENIIRHYEKLAECKVKRGDTTLYHKQYPFMLCHLDGEIENQQKVLECKFAMFAKDDWGPNGSDIVPLHYIVQVQYQMAVTGYLEADLAVLIGGWDFRIYHFKRNEAIISKITEEVIAFWKCVESDTPPALRDRCDVELAHPLSNGNLKLAEPEVIDAIEQFRDIRAKAKELDAKKDELSNVITLFIKDAEGIKTDTEILATWKPTVRGNRVLKISEQKL